MSREEESSKSQSQKTCASGVTTLLQNISNFETPIPSPYSTDVNIYRARRPDTAKAPVNIDRTNNILFHPLPDVHVPLLWVNTPRRNKDFVSTMEHQPILESTVLMVQALIFSGNAGPNGDLWAEKKSAFMNNLILETWGFVAVTLSRDGTCRDPDVADKPEPDEARRVSFGYSIDSYIQLMGRYMKAWRHFAAMLWKESEKSLAVTTRSAIVVWYRNS